MRESARGWTKKFSVARGGKPGRRRLFNCMEELVPSILVVEDDALTRTFLADNLTADGYNLLEAGSASDGARLLQSAFPDVGIVDLGLPDGDGLDLLRLVRDADRVAGRIDPELPLLVLSGRVSELDRLRAFDRGCDDYLVKPFSYQELRARVAALLRRTRHRPHLGRLRVGSLEIDPLSRQVWLRGAALALQEGVRTSAGPGLGTHAGFHAR